jgi:hypothetical protein
VWEQVPAEEDSHGPIMRNHCKQLLVTMRIAV